MHSTRGEGLCRLRLLCLAHQGRLSRNSLNIRWLRCCGSRQACGEAEAEEMKCGCASCLAVVPVRPSAGSSSYASRVKHQ